MPKSLPVKKRWEIVFLATHRLGPKLGIKGISKEIKCAKSAVQHWIKVQRETGDVQEIPHSGRSKITGPKEDQMIKNISLSNPEATAEQISQLMKNMGIFVSSSTVRRRLASSGMVYARPVSKPYKKNHRIERLKFARRNKSRNWNEIFFTDETTFQLQANPEKFWMKRRKKIIVRKVKHPQKIHAWGSFSKNGFGDLVLFTGTLNTSKLIEIYKTGLIPSANFLFDGDWTLQEDNDPKHMSRK